MVPTDGVGAEQWRLTNRGDGWTGIGSYLLDEEGEELRIQIKRNKWGYGACAFGTNGAVCDWVNGKTPDEAIDALERWHESAALTPPLGSPPPEANPKNPPVNDLPF